MCTHDTQQRRDGHVLQGCGDLRRRSRVNGRPACGLRIRQMVHTCADLSTGLTCRPCEVSHHRSSGPGQRPRRPGRRPSGRRRRRHPGRGQRHLRIGPPLLRRRPADVPGRRRARGDRPRGRGRRRRTALRGRRPGPGRLGGRMRCLPWLRHGRPGGLRRRRQGLRRRRARRRARASCSPYRLRTSSCSASPTASRRGRPAADRQPRDRLGRRPAGGGREPGTPSS